jgi:hypothetical protein
VLKKFINIIVFYTSIPWFGSNCRWSRDRDILHRNYDETQLDRLLKAPSSLKLSSRQPVRCFLHPRLQLHIDCDIENMVNLFNYLVVDEEARVWSKILVSGQRKVHQIDRDMDVVVMPSISLENIFFFILLSHNNKPRYKLDEAASREWFELRNMHANWIGKQRDNPNYFLT